jgi:hypothetical protein
MPEGIFGKQCLLKSSTMAIVAERRFEDAKALCDLGQNARANGAAYLVGFVIEILLKARLVDKHPAIARKRPHEVIETERPAWRLIWQNHDLEGMLEALPELAASLKVRGARANLDYLGELKKVCATWTIFARYSPQTIQIDQARDLLERVRLLKELLK